MGFGMGDLLSTAAIVIIQDSVAWAQRGSATASQHLLAEPRFDLGRDGPRDCPELRAGSSRAPDRP